MRRVLCLFALVVIAALPAAAQAPKAEVFGGYSYVRVNPGSGIDGINLNGWNASVTGNLNDWFGITGDFGGVYGSPNISGTSVNTNAHTFLFGPTIKARSDKLEPFAHALFGGARLKGSSLGVSASDTSFAMALGGGVDWKANDAVSIRLAQFDYLLTRFGGDSQHNARISAGIVFRFGR